MNIGEENVAASNNSNKEIPDNITEDYIAEQNTKGSQTNKSKPKGKKQDKKVVWPLAKQ